MSVLHPQFLNTQSPLLSPVSSHPGSRLVIKTFVSGRTRTLAMKSPALDFSNCSELIITCGAAHH